MRLHRLLLFPQSLRNPIQIKDSAETDTIVEFSSSRYTGCQILRSNGLNLPIFFNSVSNLLLRPFTFFKHGSILTLYPILIFLLESTENQQITRNRHHIHNQLLKIYRLQKVWAQTDRISSSFQWFFDLLKFFDLLQRKT